MAAVAKCLYVEGFTGVDDGCDPTWLNSRQTSQILPILASIAPGDVKHLKEWDLLITRIPAMEHSYNTYFLQYNTKSGRQRLSVLYASHQGGAQLQNAINRVKASQAYEGAVVRVNPAILPKLREIDLEIRKHSEALALLQQRRREFFK